MEVKKSTKQMIKKIKIKKKLFELLNFKISHLCCQNLHLVQDFGNRKAIKFMMQHSRKFQMTCAVINFIKKDLQNLQNFASKKKKVRIPVSNLKHITCSIKFTVESFPSALDGGPSFDNGRREVLASRLKMVFSSFNN